MTEISALLTVRDWDLTRVDMCLRSLRAQKDVDSEIVVVDYGSTDKNGLASVVSKHDCVYVRVEAAEWSRSNAMNVAAKAASGRYLIFADADLVFAPDVLSSTVSRLSADPNSVLLFQFRDLPGSILPEDLLDDVDFEYLDSMAVWRPRWGMGVQAYTAELFTKIRGFDDRMKIYGGEDNDIAKRARFNGFRLRWVNGPEFGLYHVWHPSSRVLADSLPETKAELEKNVEIAKNDRSRIRNFQSWRGDVPLVSVVITTFNRAEYLKDSIDSVLNQTFQDFEILILDDGSTDDTDAVVAGYSDERVKYFRFEKSGIPRLRNLALDISRGKFTAVHDDDDIMVPWSLETRLAAIGPGDTGSYGGAYDFDNDTGSMHLFPGRVAELASVLNGAKVFYHATLLIESSVLRAVRYDEAFQSGSDFNLALRIMKSGAQLAHCGDIVLLRRLHHRQVTVTDQSVQHGASYSSSFSQRAAWGTGGRWRSRERSKEIESWNYPDDVKSIDRFVPYLPKHLVSRAVLCIGSELDPNGGRLVLGSVGMQNEHEAAVLLDGVSLLRLAELNERIPKVRYGMFASRVSDELGDGEKILGCLRVLFPRRRFGVVNPHLVEQGFVVRLIEDGGSLDAFDLVANSPKECVVAELPSNVSPFDFYENLVLKSSSSRVLHEIV